MLQRLNVYRILCPEPYQSIKHQTAHTLRKFLVKECPSVIFRYNNSDIKLLRYVYCLMFLHLQVLLTSVS